MSKNKATEPLDGAPNKRSRDEIEPVSLFDEREDSNTSEETSSDLEEAVLAALIDEHDYELFNPEYLRTPPGWRNLGEAPSSPIPFTPLRNFSLEEATTSSSLSDDPLDLFSNTTSPNELNMAFIASSSNSSSTSHSSPNTTTSSGLDLSQERPETLSLHTTTGNHTAEALEFVLGLTLPPYHGINLASAFLDH